MKPLIQWIQFCSTSFTHQRDKLALASRLRITAYASSIVHVAATSTVAHSAVIIITFQIFAMCIVWIWNQTIYDKSYFWQPNISTYRCIYCGKCKFMKIVSLTRLTGLAKKKKSSRCVLDLYMNLQPEMLMKLCLPTLVNKLAGNGLKYVCTMYIRRCRKIFNTCGGNEQLFLEYNLRLRRKERMRKPHGVFLFCNVCLPILIRKLLAS